MRIMKIIIMIFMVMSFHNYWSQSKVPNNYSNDTIVVIITLNNNELRGLLVEENFTTISLEIANEVKTFRKDNLKSYRYITCLLYTSPSPRDRVLSRMPSSA